jgi:hypothetical protein
MNLSQLFVLLKKLLDNKTSLQESWAGVSIGGNHYASAATDLKNVFEFLKLSGNQNLLTIKLDGENIQNTELNEYLETSFNNWNLHLNKNALATESSKQNFFCDKSSFVSWLDKSDPFDTHNPFHKLSPLVIYVDDLSQSIIGQSFQIIPFGQSVQTNSVQYKIPSSLEVNKVVHSVSAKDIVIDPSHFVFTPNDDTELENKLYKLAILTLAASVVNDFYSVEKVITDGIRRIEMKLFENADTISKKEYHNLLKLVSWIYEEKTTTRQKLFSDRITLELDESKSFVFALSQHLENSLLQAEQRYNFVILERKDKYISELKDLLKDIRNQSDLYSQKIRTLLNNLLRDVLAAVVLVGFTLFTKFSDNIQLDKELLLTYVFNGLALYYVASILFQAIVDFTDIYVSSKEILYWKNATKELLPEKEFTKHIENSLKGRKRSLWIIYSLIALMYLSVSLACYKFPVYFQKISTKKVEIHNDKIPQHTAPKDSCSQGGK